MSERSTFAFIIHPIDPQRDIARKYPALGQLPVWLLEFLSIFYPPVFISEIEGVRSVSTGNEARGWFLACPLTPRLMLKLPAPVVYRKIIQTGRVAERLGAKILGLGAFTSVAGDGGITIARQLNIPVTTGDSYTVAVAVEAIRAAAQRMEIDLARSTAAVVGAYGAIGTVCAQMLATEVDRLLMIGRKPEQLHSLAQRIRETATAQVETATDVASLRQAQLIITVTSDVDTVIQPEHLQPGTVVCDVARPRDVSRTVATERPDVLVIEGGMVKVPGKVNFNFDFGFPPGMAYACMAETVALALNHSYESFTLGKYISLAQVDAIDRIATNHGFKLGGFRHFERAVTEEEIVAVKAHLQLAGQEAQ